jgi:alpha-tubulin suppressor-like RCC1 family protein
MEPVPEGIAAVLYDFTHPAAGGRHACVKVTNTSGGNSSIHCWGADLQGQQGNDGAIPGPNQLTPGPVNSSSTFDRLAAGGDFQCALPTGGGTPKCWGENAKGQLGVGNTTKSAVPVAVQMPGGSVSFVAIAAGDEHACGLTSQGVGYCWGENSSGQLGDGTNTDRNVPTLIAGGMTWTTISAGGQFTCAVQVSTQTGYCWGENADGQLGIGTTVDKNSPSTSLSGGDDWKTIKAGGASACAINDIDKLYCWGSDSHGQNGWTPDGGELILPVDYMEPRPTDGNREYSGVDLGAQHGCASRLSDGKLYCWGRASEGQLGNSTLSPNVPSPTAVPGNIFVTNAALGARFTVVRTTAGEILTWGSNGNGQLGDGGLVTRNSPLQILP